MPQDIFGRSMGFLLARVAVKSRDNHPCDFPKFEEKKKWEGIPKMIGFTMENPINIDVI